MPRPGPDPLAAADRLVVDATNLLHALRRGPGTLPPAALIGRIRAAVAPAASIDLVFDGSPEPGMRRARVAAGVRVRYAAPVSADTAILELLGGLDAADRERALVVTDDGELRAASERLGARTARGRWLVQRLERGVLMAPSAGNRRPPTSPAAPAAGARSGATLDRSASTPPDEDGPRWRPGRRATVKRGNPRRGHRPRG